MIRAIPLPVVVATLLAATPLAAAPPADVRAACEAAYADAAIRRQCIQNEVAAKGRIERARTAFHGPARQLFDYCESQTMSWHVMESCVRQNGVRSQPEPGTGGGLGGLVGAMNRASGATRRLTNEMRELRDATREAADAAKEAGPPLENMVPAVPPPPSVQVWGPVAAPTPAPTTPPQQPVPEARPLTPAEIQAQTERASQGSGGGRCTTKTYGGGAAVTVCE